MDETTTVADTLCHTPLHNSPSSSTTLITNHKVIMGLICSVLQEAQVKGPNKICLRQLAVVRNKCNRKYFARILFRAMVLAFNSKETTKYVKNLLNFFYAAVKSLSDSEEGGGDDFESLIQLILSSCVKHHSDKRLSVRCHIIIVCCKLLDGLPHLSSIDQKLQLKIKTMLLERVQDKVAQIRNRSVSALRHFQLIDDVENCEVTEALLFHLRHDPSVEVRSEVLLALNVNQRTLEFIVEKISEVSEQVRMSAFAKISKKVSMEMINSEAIEQILIAGLTDQSAKVQSAAELVVEAWLSFYQNEIPTFLSRLEVLTHEKAAYVALNNIFKETNTKYFEKVDMGLWQDDKLITLEKLDASVAFYWKVVLCKFSTVPYCASLLVPTVHDICNHVLKFFEDYEARYSDDPDGNGPFILLQLLEILICASKSMEEGGRREIVEFIRLAFDFDFLVATHVRPLLELFYHVHHGNEDALFFELIQNMLESRAESSQVSKAASLPPTVTIPSEDEIRGMKVEIANLIHERHKLSREKEAAVAKNAFLEAHAINTEIEKLMGQEEDMRAKMTAPGKPVLEEEESMECIEEPKQLSDFLPSDLCIAFAAFFEYFQRQETLSSSARAFYETIVVKSMMCTMDRVREYVLKCMCVVGLKDELDAQKAMLIFIQAFVYDEECIQAVAYRCIFDFILHYGFDFFDEQGPSLKMLLLEKLNSQNLEIVDLAVKGVIKLFLGNRLCSRNCTVKLLLHWINPVLAGSELEKVIEVWLPEFVKMGTRQAMAMEEALVPALRKICSAGNSSPLVDASPEKLCRFVSVSTNAEALRKCVPSPENVHGKLIESLLDGMENLGASLTLSTFAKALKFFSVHGMSEKALQVLVRKGTRILKSSNNKLLNVSLSAFLKYLNAEVLLVGDKEEISDDAYDTAISESDESLNIPDDSEEEARKAEEEEEEEEAEEAEDEEEEAEEEEEEEDEDEEE